MTPSPPEAFVQWVRNALAHLYDYPYLQTHPLADRCPEGGDARSRAQALRRILLECLDALAAQNGAPATEANRAYAVLTYHYVDGLAMGEIAQQLALSQRQTYREHEKGIKALASLLWDRLGLEQAAFPSQAEENVTPQADAAQEEVERLLQGAQYETLDLAQALDDALRLVAPLAQKRGLTWAVSAPRVPLQVWADRTLVRQILINLLGHALAWGCQGELRISLAPGDHALEMRLQGEATAAGTRPETMPASLQVNLAVARRLAEAQGGRLELDSGARWEARLLLPSVSRATILVIDDNADLITLVQRYLGAYPLTVTGCLDGRQALQLAGEQQPALILLDLMMPSLDGWDLLRQLKASPVTAGIPVIICSVLNQVEMAMSLGASDYVVKPVSQTELLQVLHRWLGPLSPQGQ